MGKVGQTKKPFVGRGEKIFPTELRENLNEASHGYEVGEGEPWDALEQRSERTREEESRRNCHLKNSAVWKNRSSVGRQNRGKGDHYERAR